MYFWNWALSNQRRTGSIHGLWKCIWEANRAQVIHIHYEGWLTEHIKSVNYRIGFKIYWFIITRFRTRAAYEDYSAKRGISVLSIIYFGNKYTYSQYSPTFKWRPLSSTSILSPPRNTWSNLELSPTYTCSTTSSSILTCTKILGNFRYQDDLHTYDVISPITN